MPKRSSQDYEKAHMLDGDILICDRYTPEAIERVKSALTNHVVWTETNPTASQLSRAVALLIRSRTKVDSDLLKHAPHLRIVITATSGFDHIQLTPEERRRIVALYTPDANAVSAAEHTLLLILSALRRATETQKALRDGRWRDGLTMGRELRGQILGIIGLGRVGTEVARRAQCFGAQVIAHDPYQKDEVFRQLGIERLGISEVFSQSDILTFHVPLNKETRRMVRSETIELMQDGVILINTSRGPVIDEGALVAALESQTVSAAALDVFEHEPLARDSRLRKLANAIVTPHIGAYTTEAYERASALAAEKLITYMKTGQTSDLIP